MVQQSDTMPQQPDWATKMSETRPKYQARSDIVLPPCKLPLPRAG
jgi:hypothetical protein